MIDDAILEAKDAPPGGLVGGLTAKQTQGFSCIASEHAQCYQSKIMHLQASIRIEYLGYRRRQ